MSSDLSGVKIDAKKGDLKGNLRFLCKVSGVGGEWLGVGGWLVEGGKMHVIYIDFITDFCGSKLTLQNGDP